MIGEPLIDTHAALGHWPWADFSALDADSLEQRLEAEGIEQAWVCATESILYPEPDRFDERLFATCQGRSRLLPVKTINPVLGNWRESLAHAVGPLGARLIKLYPNYHRYPLLDEPAMELARTVAALGLPLLISLRVEDERNQSPLLQLAAVPVAEVATFAVSNPRLRILVLGAQYGEVATLLNLTPNLYCDIAFAETGDGLEPLLPRIPEGRLLFGTHTPFFYPRAAVRKLAGAQISAAARRQIAHTNARAFLAGTAG